MADRREQLAEIFEPGYRLRWVLLVALAVAVSLTELVGALLIFTLLGLVTGTAKTVSLPVIGDLGARFPDLTREQLVVYTSLFIAVFFIGRAVLYLAQSYAQNRVAQNAGVRLSARLMRAYLRMPYEQHVRRNSSELMRNAFGSVAEIVSSVLVPAVAVLTEALIILGIFVALMFVAPAATLVTGAVVLPLVFVLLRVVQPRMARLGRLNQQTAEQGLKTLQQGLGGLRDIRILGREQYFETQFIRSRAQGARTSYLRAVLTEAPRAIIEASLVLFIVAFLLVTIRSSGSPEEVLGVLGLFAYAVLRVLPSVNRMVANVNSIRFGAAAINYVVDDLILLRALAAEDRTSAASPMPFVRRLELQSVCFRYAPDAPFVVRDIDLVIEAGQSLGIVGSTGAGKTTLLDLVVGLLEPTSGRVLVDGVDIRTNLRGWYANLGVVSQSVFLVDETLRRNIALGDDDGTVDEDRLSWAINAAQLEPVIEQLEAGLDTVVGERGVRLSGGQRQRVAIARALYRNPAVLIFDEGTSALDNVTEAAFTDALTRFRGQRTLLTVAHRLSTVRFHDRIAVLDEGRIVSMGTYDELLANSALFRAMAT